MNIFKFFVSFIGIVSLFFATAGTIFGGQVIKLQPGSNITLKPSEETTIICEGASASPQPSPVTYCKCKWETLNQENTLLKKGYALYKVTITGGNKVEDLVNIYDNDKKACEAAVTANPACK